MPDFSRPFSDARRLALALCLGACVAAAAAVAEEPAPEVPSDPPSVPFRPRSGPRGATLFTTLSPEQTGITAVNHYDDPAMWGSRFHEFNAGPIGTGVAIGDFDGDGLPDIFVVSKTGPNHLYRNLGGMRFEDVTERAGVAGPVDAWKQGAAFVDLNNNGLLDIYVCRFGAPNLLYINQGDGTFREEAGPRGLALKDASGMAAFCDYDRDGWLDVFVQTNLLDSELHPTGQRNHLFHNNGNGTFSEVTASAGISGEARGHSATWWDFDEDGWPDLYIANDFAEPDKLYHNNGNGTFTDVLSGVVPHTPHFSMGADTADLLNEGHLDLLVADMAGSTRAADYRGMAKLRSALPADDNYPHAAPQYMQNALYIGTGTNRVLEGARLAGLDSTDWTFSVLMQDFDLDGRVDVYLTNGMVREFTNADLVERSLRMPTLEGQASVMKMSPPLAQRHLAFRNNGNLSFESVGPAWGLDHVGVGFGAAFGDLDGDGDLDLVFTNYNGQVTVCRNDIDTGHAVIFDLRGTVSNRFGVGATVRIITEDGKQMRTLSLNHGYLSTSEPMVHFGLGKCTVVKQVSVEWPSGRRQSYANLPADRRYTLTEPRSPAAARPVPAPTLFTQEAPGAGLAVVNHESPINELRDQPLLPFRMNRPGPALACADFDGDGEDDLALGGVAGEPGRLLANLGGGTFIQYGGSLFSENAAVADGPILAFDALANGRQDLLITKAGVAAPDHSRAYQPKLWINDGKGHFSAAPEGMIPDLPISAGAVAAADFTHCGRLGFFIGGRIAPGHYPQAPQSALLLWRDGRFVDVIDEMAPSLKNRGMVTAAVWTDVDGDGWPDLVVAFDWGPVACYRNVQGKRLEDASERLGFPSGGTGWWRSLAVADFNGDGRPDIVAGNIGLNTRYRASRTEPTLLYDGVVLGGSAPQLIEAQADNGVWYPLRTRETLASVFPGFTRRFPTSDAYARAPLAEVFPSPALDAATKYAATELRSGIFLSQPDGTYRFTPLPRLAQIAPVHGIVAGDFDGDGRTDIALVGNWYAPISEVGHFDGGIGWLLKGDGTGRFEPVPASDSGIVVPGDARAMAVADFNQDGWPDLVVTRNNDTAAYFVNHGRPRRHSFGVALRGQEGNPTAVGARVRLTLADGSTQMSEVTAGSGYMTQSSATLFFGYPDEALPRSLEVRWPDGRPTTQAFAGPPPALLRLVER